METRDKLTELLGLADPSPQDRLAMELAEEDEALLDELVAIRKRNKLTQAQVAAAIGRDQSAISQFERLGGDPRLSTIRRYALAVGASVSHHVVNFAAETPEHTSRWVAAFSPGGAKESSVKSALEERAEEVWNIKARNLGVMYAGE
ncbi:helix-turn-helix domain-containing protein [Brevibacterium casei]|uniref:helix-turn-helix domain-containing protein n=1 Tax=Brevibacterium casei TaxID=33889 RepID=UPI00193104B0|nr:helix-turn-helix transcriptional regulator [Brevibacterium casei]